MQNLNVYATDFMLTLSRAEVKSLIKAEGIKTDMRQSTSTLLAILVNSTSTKQDVSPDLTLLKEPIEQKIALDELQDVMQDVSPRIKGYSKLASEYQPQPTAKGYASLLPRHPRHTYRSHTQGLGFGKAIGSYYAQRLASC